MQRGRCILVCTCLTVLGCGGSSASAPKRVSNGLKIFVTSRNHSPDFKNDPHLNGDSAIHKADDFCNTDPNRPDAHAYKALLVDGVDRDAKALTDWVLEPGTSYYRPYDDIVIGTTNKAAIFGVPLTNAIVGSVADIGTSQVPMRLVWTGIANPADFAAGESCNGWSDMASSSSARSGNPTATDGDAFGTIGAFSCPFGEFSIYCVEQP
jgi:uncharacterized protein DUF1554